MVAVLKLSQKDVDMLNNVIHYINYRIEAYTVHLGTTLSNEASVADTLTLLSALTYVRAMLNHGYVTNDAYYAANIDVLTATVNAMRKLFNDGTIGDASETPPAAPVKPKATSPQVPIFEANDFTTKKS